MKKRPWMPLWIADYRNDTGHLSTFEHGAYLLLIMHYWEHGGLPDDDEQLRRIAGTPPPQWKKIKPVMKAFFGGHDLTSWRQKRIDHELALMIEISNKRKDAALQKHIKQRANAGQEPCKCIHTSHYTLDQEKQAVHLQKKNGGSNLVFVAADDPQWPTLAKRWREKNNRDSGPPVKNFGWYFPASWIEATP